jgi:type VI secretion system protein ImpF
MREPRPTEGARALLFDRLVDLEPGSHTEVQPLRVLNREELKESVRRELARLLNTRAPLSAHHASEGERTVTDYGVPDVSALSPQNPDDQRLLALMLSRTIAAYEPRLQQVRVTVEPTPGQPRVLGARIEAVLVVAAIIESVAFPVLLHPKSGEAEVYAS